mmetsp:Transcript_74979/g.163687  ORF Transcript_74979/g.163687 Transcript_74979/m.163687 type:complete len:969 (+) Transcript_74979:121-3027(+)
MKADYDEDMKEDEMKQEIKEEEKNGKPVEIEEEDAKPDERGRVEADIVTFGQLSESTLNVAPTCGGRILMSLGDSGLQYLTAATRCNVGLTAGRYFFEIRIVETRHLVERDKIRARHDCILGFTTKGSPLHMADSSESIGFSSDGCLLKGRATARTPIVPRFKSQTVYGILLNLDGDSPNVNTISLFRDGQRLCPPQPLPESLHGKALYPTVNYRNLSLHVNFGPTSWAPLPFVCRMVQDAAQEDTEMMPPPSLSEDGKAEAVFPICLPDEGGFEFLDSFLRDHPQHQEVSNRSLLSWCEQSNLRRTKRSSEGSNDKPEFSTGVRDIDEYLVQSSLRTVMSMLPRNCAVMEVRNNLLAEERSRALTKFDRSSYRRIALVAVGEPPESFKEKAWSAALEEKRKAVGEATRKKLLAEKDSRQPGDEVEDLEGSVLMAQEACMLTNEEKQSCWFAKKEREDLSKGSLGRHFANFSLPDLSEGWDEVRYVWQDESSASAYLKEWIAARKLTLRIEDLQPGQHFKEQVRAYEQTVLEWKHRQSEVCRRPAPPRDAGDEKRRRLEDGTAVEESASKTWESTDPMLVENIDDIGDGRPLYEHFAWEDWAMLNLRFELHVLLHSFRIDANDPQRTSFHESQLPFYYERYFRKALEPQNFGCQQPSALLTLVEDTVQVSPSCLLEPQLSDDTPLEVFVRLTEDERRERQLQLALGRSGVQLTLRPAAAATGIGAVGASDRRPSARRPSRGNAHRSRSRGRPSRSRRGDDRNRPPRGGPGPPHRGGREVARVGMSGPHSRPIITSRPVGPPRGPPSSRFSSSSQAPAIRSHPPVMQPPTDRFPGQGPPGRDSRTSGPLGGRPAPRSNAPPLIPPGGAGGAMSHHHSQHRGGAPPPPFQARTPPVMRPPSYRPPAGGSYGGSSGGQSRHASGSGGYRSSDPPKSRTSSGSHMAARGGHSDRGGSHRGGGSSGGYGSRRR